MTVVSVKILAYNGDTVLLETATGRRILPKNAVLPNNTVLESQWLMGIEQDWWLTELPQPHQITSEDVAQALRKRGIWTPEDALARPNAVLGALNALYGVELASILDHARRARGSNTPLTPKTGGR